MTSKTTNKFSSEVRARAVRMVLDYSFRTLTARRPGTVSISRTPAGFRGASSQAPGGFLWHEVF
jgi:hypothetical protein